MRIRLSTLVLITILGMWANAQPKRAPTASWTRVEKLLRGKGFTKSFLKSMQKSYSTQAFEQVVELNVLLYLRTDDYHGVQVSNDAIRDVRDFMQTHHKALASAQKRYQVKPSVIASLLWIESRHGGNVGEFHVPSVYLHLVQAAEPAVITYLQKNASKYSAKPVTARIKKEIGERARKKSTWAIGELKALQKMHSRDPKMVRDLRGSFAGAFGMPQFIPSSYVRWAKAPNAKQVPHLNQADHAIHSVAHYLNGHGWRANKAKTFLRSLMKYNNSRDYAQAILNLANKVDPLPERRPSGKK